MQKHDRWLEEEEDRRESRPSSRRNSASLSRRGSLNKEPEGKKPLGSSSSCNSTPKRIHKPQNNCDFVVTGKQISSRGERALSLPGGPRRRSSADLKSKRSLDSARNTLSPTPKSRENSLEDDVSLDLSQVSDFEDLSSKYGLRSNLSSLAAVPKKSQKPRSSSVQGMAQQREPKRLLKSDKRSRESNCSRDSRDSFHKSSSLTYRQAMSTELEYSSMSPEYSPSSADSVAGAPDTLPTPSSREPQDYSCVSTWPECSDEVRESGEWSHFWANYNNSLARVPVARLYDQCPTPYRSDDIQLADMEFSAASSRKRSPDNLGTINNIIRNEGLKLTPRETQNIIKCAHMLGNVLSKAIERQANRISPEKLQAFDPETQIRKKSLTLNLKETVIPMEVKEEKSWESVPTQTDISLPNTKSAPKIFENILRQLSKSSLEEVAVREQNKEVNKED